MLAESVRNVGDIVRVQRSFARCDHEDLAVELEPLWRNLVNHANGGDEGRDAIAGLTTTRLDLCMQGSHLGQIHGLEFLEDGNVFVTALFPEFSVGLVRPHANDTDIPRFPRGGDRGGNLVPYPAHGKVEI